MCRSGAGSDLAAERCGVVALGDAADLVGDAGPAASRCIASRVLPIPRLKAMLALQRRRGYEWLNSRRQKGNSGLMWAVEALKQWRDFYTLVGTAGATFLR